MTDNPVLDVLDTLREYGWIKDSFGDTTRGFCLAGAIRHACCDTDIHQVKRHRVADSIARAIGIVGKPRPTMAAALSILPMTSIEGWNDHRLRTFADVEKMLLRAAEIYEFGEA